LELRKDYLLDRWVIISEKRAKRPREFHRKREKKHDKNCVFCRGNENLTPKETYRVEENGEWIIRCFKNKFPAVRKIRIKKSEKRFFVKKSAYGYHEVIVDSPYHNKQLDDLPEEHIKKLLEVFINRIKELSKDKKIQYVAVFKNHERDAGTSIIHSHCQIIAYNHKPSYLIEKVKAVARFKRKYKKCPYCEILKKEAESERRCYITKTCVSFAPFASRYSYEIAILPKRHVHSIVELNEEELRDMAFIIKRVLVKLRKINAPYNLYLHNAPDHKDLHFQLKINPRLNIFGGFELETRTVINPVSPEEAARFYRK